MTKSAFYAGSFDPVTNGHVEVVRAACRLLDRLVIAIGTHPGKSPLFTAEERVSMLKSVFEPMAKKENCKLDVITFDDLTVNAARRHEASILLRGLRDGTDLDYEMQIAGMNGQMAPDLQTVFLPASPAVRPITATLVRQVASMGGDVSAFVPELVARKLTEKFASGR
ncbi:phosphopantetheine adenylyltransferase [Terrihabitans soli]|uniref:Phosphopantetheine adenylyltransferase n=1 Tax=Terrihabitans soli TaxID=708113 RepID=A0A6S6QUH1_9HYPH|nr:pantetheine-phosphate adenylyltransferase [Terrihabitans soli]BCJ90912.1 phosphopantetheine adenylyltransferase [Terrihabitans soli]